MSRKIVTVIECDGCGASNVSMTPWRLSRGSARIRRADLCQDCEKPLLAILSNSSSAAGSHRGLPAVKYEDLPSSKKRG